MSLEEVEALPDPGAAGGDTETREALVLLTKLIQRLKPPDRQVILAYLEGLDAGAIGEVAGISPAHVATKIYRIKRFLASHAQKGGCRE